MRAFKISKERITGRETQSFTLYLQEVSKIERLTVDEEYALSLKAFNGDKVSLDELVRRNLRFVISVAKQYVTSENTIEDLVNEGNYGLTLAANEFDPNKGFKFITYAVWWIRKTIIMSINDNNRTVRLPYNKLTIISKLRDSFTTLEQIYERTPTMTELYEFVNLNYTMSELYPDNNEEVNCDVQFKDIQFFYENDKENIGSIDKPVDESETNTNSFSDLLEDNVYGEADKNMVDDDTNNTLIRLLSVLKNDTERNVIKLLFGLDGSEGLSIRETAEKLEMTNERVRQIKIKCVETLKKNYSKIL